MDKQKCYFAVDLGATSGRTMVGGFKEDGSFFLDEVNRFPNHLIRLQGHIYWDLPELYRNIVEGLSLAARMEDKEIVSIGIDTWGCDFAFFGKDGSLVRLPYAYRDAHTRGASKNYFQRVPEEKVYSITGIQVMDFNSLFQLETLRRNFDSALEMGESIQFVPCALAYMLTGKKSCEYSIATTAQIVDAKRRQLSDELLATLCLRKDSFGRFVYPGEKIGTLTPEVQELTGLGPVDVLAVASHDTASAVAAIPSRDPGYAYLSSGTWSLMGIETNEPILNEKARTLNFTNEGGVLSTIRFLKNITGMWLLEQARLAWPELSYADLNRLALEAEPLRSLVDPDDESLASPKDMCKAICDLCASTDQPVPETPGQFVRCILESLALKYSQVLEDLRGFSPITLRVLHIIGGGARNDILNQWTADACGIRVIAGPYEATGMGNVMIQAMADEGSKDLFAMRERLAPSVSLKTYEPQNMAPWAEALRRLARMKKA